MHFPNFIVFLFCVLEITVDFIDEIHPGMTEKVGFSRVPLMILTSQNPSEAEGGCRPLRHRSGSSTGFPSPSKRNGFGGGSLGQPGTARGSDAASASSWPRSGTGATLASIQSW
jgi:hypothetical protein